MLPLKPDETALLGKWVRVEGRVVADETAERIEYLISHELEQIAVTGGGWDVLYRDPRDGRYWELTFPEGHMHGGGPPRLTYLTHEQARGKYGNVEHRDTLTP